MSEERKRILKLLEDKKITAEEAERLLEALAETPRGKTLRILVFKGGNKPTTRVEIPLGLARWAAKFVPEQELAKHGVNPKQIVEAIENDVLGKVVDVTEDDRRVEVYIA
jgi:hypothetical protein